MIKKISYILTIILFSLCFIKTEVHASNIYFEENFDTLNVARWESFGEVNSVYVNNGLLYLTPPPAIYSSYVRSIANPFPLTGDFGVEYRFQYPTLTFAGIGIVIGEDNPDYPVLISDPVSSRILTTWQDSLTPLLGLHDSNVYFNLSNSTTTSFHVYRADYIDGIYKIYLDDNLIYTSNPSGRRPRAIWFGNPGPADSTKPWTELSIDYLKVYQYDSNSPYLMISSLYDSLNKQVPIDRSLSLVANLRDASGEAVAGATVSAQVLDSSNGTLRNTTATTINNGDAYFTFDPNTSEGNVQIQFSYLDTVESYSFTLYRPPVVIVPGMGASMNTQKFYFDDSNQTDWGWSPTAAGGWDKVTNTLVANGYQQDNSYTIAFYDWRKSLDKNIYNDFEVEAVFDNLKPNIQKMLEGKPEGRKVNILAHSFGGLVARTMIQNDWDENRVNKFITFGTPHSGASAAYYIWNGGEMPPTGDAMFRFVMGTLLKIHKYHFGLPEMSVIRNTFSGVQQLLPIYPNYVFRYSGPIGTDTLTFQNNILGSDVSTGDFEQDVDEKNIEFLSVYGTGEKTLRDIKVGSEIGIDIWPDGKPEKKPVVVDGDDSVLPESAKIANLFYEEIESKHADLADNSLSLIASEIKLNLSDRFDLSTPKTFLGAVVMSPARPQILNENGEAISIAESFNDYPVNIEGISDVPDGMYTVQVIGTGAGNYTLYIPFAGETRWDELVFTGSTMRREIDEFPIYVSNSTNGGNISKIDTTTMTWQMGTINFFRKVVPIDYILKLPDNFDTSQLYLDKVRFNGHDLQIINSKVDKKNRRLRISLNGREVANTIDWSESEREVKMIVGGENTSLVATLKLRVPWALYKKYM